MARSERQDDRTRGGVGTMARSGTRPRPQQEPEVAPDPRRGRQPRPVPPQRPVTGQRAPVVERQGDVAPRPQRVPAQAAGAKRRGAPEAVAAPARPGPRPRSVAPWRVPPAERGTGPEQVRTTGPQPAVTRVQSARTAATLASSRRMRFVLLLCGLLGGALVSALVISTTLAQGSFQINKLQDSTSALARQRQTLEEQVAQAQSAQVIEQRASKLGMRRPGELLFLDLKTGKTTNDGPTWIGAVNAPGYAP
jgi:cell division protein FtsB